MGFLELAGLTKKYGGRAVVDRVDLDIAKGSLVSLLGPSGCGKTTTLRLLAGFIEPDAGEIRVGGRTIAAPGAALPPERRNMAMIFQSYALWPHMTVMQNVTYGLELRRIGRGRDAPQGRCHPRAHQALAVRRALSRRALRRPAAARFARPRAGHRARDPAARRAAVEPRRQPARGDALRDPPPARRAPLHHGLRHPRPVRGDVDGRPDRRHEPRRDRAGRQPRGHLPAAPTEFVARFIGGTNIFKGDKSGADAVDCGNGLVLRCSSGEFAAAGQTAVSVRQHHIRLEPDARLRRHQLVAKAPSIARCSSAPTAPTWSRCRAERPSTPPPIRRSHSPKASPSGYTSRRSTAAHWPVEGPNDQPRRRPPMRSIRMSLLRLPRRNCRAAGRRHTPRRPTSRHRR